MSIFSLKYSKFASCRIVDNKNNKQGDQAYVLKKCIINKFLSLDLVKPVHLEKPMGGKTYSIV